jgi:hypothetical protein
VLIINSGQASTHSLSRECIASSGAESSSNMRRKKQKTVQNIFITKFQAPFYVFQNESHSIGFLFFFCVFELLTNFPWKAYEEEEGEEEEEEEDAVIVCSSSK